MPHCNKIKLFNNSICYIIVDIILAGSKDLKTSINCHFLDLGNFDLFFSITFIPFLWYFGDIPEQLSHCPLHKLWVHPYVPNKAMVCFIFHQKVPENRK